VGWLKLNTGIEVAQMSDLNFTFVDGVLSVFNKDEVLQVELSFNDNHDVISNRSFVRDDDWDDDWDDDDDDDWDDDWDDCDCDCEICKG
jgi:hypothetical protein